MTTFSVIIPHYNSLETLARAINSVPQYDNIEVIVIDNSPNPINESDIKNVSRHYRLYYSSPMKGAGCARNKGLEVSKNDYLLFLDADDYFTEQLHNILDNFEKCGYSGQDIIFFRARSIYSHNSLPAQRESGYMKWFDKYQSYQSKNNLDAIRFYYFVPWGKFYRRLFIKEHNITFDEVPASNNIMFTTKAAVNSINVKVDNNILYVVTVTDNSLTKTKNSRNIRSRFLVYIDHNNYLKKHGYKKYCIDLIRPLKNLYSVSLNDFLWGIRQCFKYKANLFDAFYKFYGNILL